MPSSEVGIIVMNSSGAIASNYEAARILAFPEKAPKDFAAILPDELRSLLVPSFARGPRIIEGQIWSGQRRYFYIVIRADCDGGNGSSTSSVALIRRAWHISAEIELITAQYSLTPRERECMEYLLVGLTNRDIARRMKISASTVNSFLHLIMLKMGVNSRCGIPLKIINALSQSPEQYAL